MTDVGIYTPALQPVESLAAGEVGFIAASIKNVKDTRVGDTITEEDRPASEPLPGYKKATPMVYCGLYPIETNQYEDLWDALENPVKRCFSSL